MSIVCTCNLIKCCCFAACLRFKKHKVGHLWTWVGIFGKSHTDECLQPLVTVGDAICCFLKNPNFTTSNLGPVSSEDVRSRLWRIHPDAGLRLKGRLCPSNRLIAGRVWKAKRHRYFSSVGKTTWLTTITTAFLVMSAGLTFLVWGLRNTWGGKSLLSHGLGLSPSTMIRESFPLLKAVVLGNTFQLIISNV